MSEDIPAYTSRVFVCRHCRSTFVPTQDELRALEMLEREFGLEAEKVDAVCGKCRKPAIGPLPEEGERK